MDNFYDKDEIDRRMDSAISEFDIEQYKKDIEQLNLLTKKILENNPICAKEVWTDSWDGTKHERDLSKKSVISGYETKTISSEKAHEPNTLMGEKLNDVIESMKTLNKPFRTLEEQGIEYDEKTQSLSTNWVKHENFRQEEKKKDPQFQKEVEDSIKKGLNRFGNDYVGKELTKEIIEKSREKITMDMPPISKELSKLGLYGVYTVSEDKFNAAYMDFVISKDGETSDDPFVFNKLINPDTTRDRTEEYKKMKYQTFKAEYDDNLNIDRTELPTLEIKLFTSVGRMKPRLIPLNDTRIEVGIKDFINDEFVKKVKEMCEKNVDDYGKSIPNHLKNPIILDGTKDNYVKVSNRISMISNFINVKNRFAGCAKLKYLSVFYIFFPACAFKG